MENKYQEALDEICNIVLESSNDGVYDPRIMRDFSQEDCVILQELVNRATPKKPERYSKTITLPYTRGTQTSYICHTCGDVHLSKTAPDGISETNNCHNCGQALDWSDTRVKCF